MSIRIPYKVSVEEKEEIVFLQNQTKLTRNQLLIAYIDPLLQHISDQKNIKNMKDYIKKKGNPKILQIDFMIEEEIYEKVEQCCEILKTKRSGVLRAVIKIAHEDVCYKVNQNIDPSLTLKQEREQLFFSVESTIIDDISYCMEILGIKNKTDFLRFAVKTIKSKIKGMDELQEIRELISKNRNKR